MNVARGSRVWDLLPRDWRPNPRLLITSIPIAVFYLLTVVASPSVAVAGGFIAAAIVFYYTRHSRLYQALSAVGFAVVTLSAAIGIIWSREKAYLAAGPASDFLFVWIYAGSVVIRQPLVGGITREVFPRLAGSLPVTASVFVWLMISWAVFDIFSGALRVYLLSNLSVGEYIIWSRVLAWRRRRPRPAGHSVQCAHWADARKHALRSFSLSLVAWRATPAPTALPGPPRKRLGSRRAGVSAFPGLRPRPS